MRGLDVLYILVVIIGAVLAIWQFYLFVVAPGTTANGHLWYAIGAAIVACVCAVAYFLRHVNKEEEIHITQ